MAKNNKDKKTLEKTPSKKKSKGMTTQELTHKHLKDSKHTITDDEIRNIDIQLDVDTGEPLDIPDSDVRPHDIDKDHRIKTPWDVMDNS